LLSTLSLSSAFYLPGLAPVNFCAKEKPAENCKSDVKLFVNRLDSEESVIPFEYSHFDFCETSSSEDSPVENLGQVVFGERIRSSPYEINFLKNEECKLLCKKTYNTGKADDREKLKTLMFGMLKNYEHHWIVDNMPVTWCYDVEGGQKYCSTGFPMGCFVDPNGLKKDACVISMLYNKCDTYYLFNHVDITITYHSGANETWGLEFGERGGRIIAVNISPKSYEHRGKNGLDLQCTDTSVPLAIPASLANQAGDQEVVIPFTYSIKPSNRPLDGTIFLTRCLTLTFSGFPSSIHW